VGGFAHITIHVQFILQALFPSSSFDGGGRNITALPNSRDFGDILKSGVTIIFIYFNRLTCAPQYLSTSDAPFTLKIASCEAKLPQKTHVLRLSFCRTIFSSRIGNSLSDIRVLFIHSLSITASAIYSCSPMYSTESFWYSVLQS
jgi:hypothetical protein